MPAPDQYASVRYLVDDVQAAADFYTTHLGFTVSMNAAPAFAQVTRGPMRLLLSGPTTSGARDTPEDLRTAGRTAFTWSSTFCMPRSTSPQSDCRSAATWSPALADAKSCSLIPRQTHRTISPA